MDKQILYLGLDPSRYPESVVHFPLIATKPRDLDAECYQKLWKDFLLFSVVVFTSRSTVLLLCSVLKERKLLDLLRSKQLLCIGKATYEALSSFGLEGRIAKEETAEGVIDLLSQETGEYILYLHSSRARTVILDFLKSRGYDYFSAPLYDTEFCSYSQLPSLTQFKEIVFTSPSTVDAFLALFKSLPQDVKLTAIGPVTLEYLNRIKELGENSVKCYHYKFC